MKKISMMSLVAVVALLISAVSARSAFSPTGNATFKFKVIRQLDALVTLKTNVSSTATNVTRTVKTSVETSKLLNKELLRLLSNSLTNLPTSITNGHLETDGFGGFFVVTVDSTNNVTSVLRYTSDDPMSSGSETVVRSSPSNAVVSETGTENWVQVGRLTYNDNSKNTGNGKHTNFTLDGLLVSKNDDHTTSFTTTFEFVGSGQGSIENNFVIISGGVRGRVTGSIDVDDEF